MAQELPKRAFFRYRIGIPARPKGLRLTGDPSRWPEESRLPRLGEIEGREDYADVHVMWDRAGLYVGASVGKKTRVTGNRRNAHAGDAVIIWIDTRDVHSVHRATRFCHMFFAVPRDGARGSAAAWQVPIQRAREQAPICAAGSLKMNSKISKTSYGMTVAIPSAALNGYDPQEFPRIGFTYHFFDHEHRQQMWSGAPGMPFGTDPSLWGTLELK